MKRTFPRLSFVTLLASLLLLSTACAEGDLTAAENQVDPENQNQVDPENQNQVDPENQNQVDPGPELPAQPSASFSSGGGEGASSGYRARVIVGAPTPAGAGQSDNYRAVMGAGPAQHTQTR